MQKNPDKIHRNDGAYFWNRSSHPADLDCLKWGNLYVSFEFHVEESKQWAHKGDHMFQQKKKLPIYVDAAQGRRRNTEQLIHLTSFIAAINKVMLQTTPEQQSCIPVL